MTVPPASATPFIAPPTVAADGYRGLWQELQFVATEYITHHSLLVPGYLQTGAYTQALLWATRPTWGATSIKQMADHRSSLRDYLLRPGGPQLLVLLGEPVLTNVVGTPAIMAEQLQLLDSLADRVTIRVMPPGPYPGISMSYILMTVPDDKRLMLVENGIENRSYAGPQVETFFSTQCGGAFQLARSADASRQLIRRYAATYADA